MSSRFVHVLLFVGTSFPFKASNNAPRDRPHRLPNISDGHLNCYQVSLPFKLPGVLRCRPGGSGRAPGSLECSMGSSRPAFLPLVLSGVITSKQSWRQLPSPQPTPLQTCSLVVPPTAFEHPPGDTSPAAVAPLTLTWSCSYKAGQASGSQHNCWGSPVSPVLSHLLSPRPLPPTPPTPHFHLLEPFSQGSMEGAKGIHAYKPKLRSDNISISACARK